ncbi:MAG: class II fructose-bisphosphate aldolase family protein [Firmicutes bacterium]|nr:class II fructose-bisphosphate aldolase family protein [Bacillota bacterium]
MLVNFKTMINEAVDKDYAIAGFNVFGYEDATAVVRAAESLNAPVMLMTNKVAVDHMPVEVLAAILCKVAEQAKVPVCVHLDHAKELGLIARAIKAGYSSVMYDGSQLPLEENIKNTQEVVKFAHACGVSVEAEIGSVGYSDQPGHEQSVYTEPAEAEKFAEETGVDALAVAIGTVHRMQVQNANIQFDRLKAIQQVVKMPLVIHGSTGITDEDLQKVASCRVGKINIGTALRLVFGNVLREEMNKDPEAFDRVKLFQKPMEKVEQEAKHKMLLLRCKDVLSKK